MVLTFNTDPVASLETSDHRRRRIVEISDGHFASRRDGLWGNVLRGGSDWRVQLNDGRMMLDGRLALWTHCGEAIALRFVGRRSGEADVLKALDRGDDVRADAYYFRLTMTFETDSARFSWLNHTIAVAKGEYRPERQVYNVLQLL
jgi:feruloyl esterase